MLGFWPFILCLSYPSLIFILLCLAHDLKKNNSHRDLLLDITSIYFWLIVMRMHIFNKGLS